MKQLFLFGLLLLGLSARAQELQFAEVRINTPTLQLADPKVFRELEGAIQQFMNNQQWGEDQFEEEERIECNLTITITRELSESQFEADFAIQSLRPVYNSTYKSAVFTYIDKGVRFDYEQFQPLEYARNTYITNLASVLAFYAYYILGQDYDTFSPDGGSRYYQEANNVITTIPPTVASSYKGWRAVDGNRNRYWLVESTLSPRIEEVRTAMYNYHRLGLDIMATDPAQGRANILLALQQIDVANREYLNAMVIQQFIASKSDEIIEIFKVATPKQQVEVIKLMQRLDASRASRYESIRR